MTEFMCVAVGCDKSTVPSQVYCAEHQQNPPPVTSKYLDPQFTSSPIERAIATQIAGEHYRKLKIQPAEFVHANNIPYLEGSIIYYVTRHREKNGVEDLRKARHTLDILIELETAKPVTQQA